MIDPNKTYRTRDGREVRIYAVDGDGEFPVHGAFLTKHGWKVEAWSASGRWQNDCEDACDLIEVKPRIKREVWVNVYPNHVSPPYENKDEANFWGERNNDRIACVKLTIDCEEGEGL
jgi:hypothetical protein